ncbi:hypothetical protein C0Q70_10537 [Pomacea canaliculata]|uniref:Uncharacterized protein n=1 Tax=Pomacea canaliculata TaxID=400727 RepID=A0A2T7P3G8_POMCA|nr:hypothetical protein C0Q70_10537 [Pomacea canaliculata]
MKSLSNSSLADNKGDTVLPWDNPLDPIGPFIEITDVLLGKEVYYKSLQFGLGIRDEMRTMAGCITLVIAIERCVCVYLPLRASSLMRTRTMAALLASIYVFTQLGFVYSFFHYDIYAKRSNSTNQTLYWVLELSTTYKKNYLLFRGFECFNGSARPLSELTVVDDDESRMDEDDENKEHSHD